MLVMPSLIWLAARLWPGVFMRANNVTEDVCFPVFLIAGPLYFVWRFMQTVREVRTGERRAGRIANGRCAECGYDLRGITAGVC